MAGFACEDATYDQNLKMIFLACRNQEAQKLSVYAIQHKKDDKVRYEVVKRVEIDFKEDLNFKVQNRVRLHHFEKTMLGSSEKILVLHDHRTSLESDKPIDEYFGLKLVKYSIQKDESGVKTVNLEVVKDNIDINEIPKSQITIYDVLPHGDDFVMLYTSTESEGNYWITTLDIEKGDEPTISYNPENAVYKSDVAAKDGYLTLTENDENGYLIYLKNDDGIFTIQKVKTKGKINAEEYKWLGQSSYFEFDQDFGLKDGKKAVRTISIGQKNGFLVALVDSTTNGVIQDNKGTLFGLFGTETREGQVEIMGALDAQKVTQSTGTIIDDVLVEFRTVQAAELAQTPTKDIEIFFRKIGAPFLSIFTGELLRVAKDNVVNLNIEFQDADAKPLTIKAKFSLVTDPYSQIEFKKKIEDVTNIKYSDGMLIQHQYSYNNLSKGNAPTVSFKYGENNPPGLKGKVLAYHKHNINFAKPDSTSDFLSLKSVDGETLEK